MKQTSIFQQIFSVYRFSDTGVANLGVQLLLDIEDVAILLDDQFPAKNAFENGLADFFFNRLFGGEGLPNGLIDDQCASTGDVIAILVNDPCFHFVFVDRLRPSGDGLLF